MVNSVSEDYLDDEDIKNKFVFALQETLTTIDYDADNVKKLDRDVDAIIDAYGIYRRSLQLESTMDEKELIAENPILGHTLCAIKEQSITTDQFNVFLESLPKSANERVLRRARLKPGTPLRPKDGSPVKKAEKAVARDGQTSPMRTRRGKNAVADQGEENKRNADKFRKYAEAVEFIMVNHGKPIEEALSNVSRPAVLHELTLRLLSQSNLKLDRDWLHSLRESLDENGPRMVAATERSKTQIKHSRRQRLH